MALILLLHLVAHASTAFQFVSLSSNNKKRQSVSKTSDKHKKAPMLKQIMKHLQSRQLPFKTQTWLFQAKKRIETDFWAIIHYCNQLISYLVLKAQLVAIKVVLITLTSEIEQI